VGKVAIPERDVVLHAVERLDDLAAVFRERLFDANPSGQRHDHHLLVGDPGFLLEHPLVVLQRRRAGQGHQVQVVERENDATGPVCQIGGRRPGSHAHALRIGLGPCGAEGVERVDRGELAIHEQLDVVLR
jgi:hypothetical protein